MTTERRIVDNRVFLLALDELYRESIKRHERGELLRCAKETADALSITAPDVPIEGYYAEDEQLAEYFRLMRALQAAPRSRELELASVGGFRRLREVTESRLFGFPCANDHLLSVGEDVLSVALKKTFPDWTIYNITQTAYESAVKSADFSLVALAALARDPVVLAALRESVVLYQMAVGGARMQQDPEYVWDVDEVIEQRAAQFVATFNDLFGESLPQPVPENAAAFWMACSEWKIVGRCVRLGFDDRTRPVRHYHWAIDSDNHHKRIVKDFWDTEIWTTARYRERQQAKHDR